MVSYGPAQSVKEFKVGQLFTKVFRHTFHISGGINNQEVEYYKLMLDNFTKKLGYFKSTEAIFT